MMTIETLWDMDRS